MIKGVNKHIIEIKELDNRYFDSALLFVSPDYDTDGEKLKKEADKILEKYSNEIFGGFTVSGNYGKKRKARRIDLSIGAVLGLAVGFALSRILF